MHIWIIYGKYTNISNEIKMSFKISWQNIFILRWVYFIRFVWYCFFIAISIFTNIHATLLVFIVNIVGIVVTIQFSGNAFFNSIFWLVSNLTGLFEIQVALTGPGNIFVLYRNIFHCLCQWVNSKRKDKQHNQKTGPNSTKLKIIKILSNSGLVQSVFEQPGP